MAATVPFARAQQSLVVIKGSGGPGLVKLVGISSGRVEAEVSDFDDLLHPIRSTIFVLWAGSTWHAGLIDVSNLKVELMPGQGVIRAYGYLKSDTMLPNCVIVLVVKIQGNSAASADNELELYPVLNAKKQKIIPAGDAVSFEHQWNLARQFNDAQCTWELHFFSDGFEMPTTLMKPEEIAAARTKSAEYLLQDHPVTLLHGTHPTFPEKLIGKSTGGSATLRCFVARNGLVGPVQIVSTTDPAFGEAASEGMMRGWLFAPAIKNRAAVESTVELRIDFTAPDPTAADAIGARQ
jgi:hypothetical protein